MRIRILNKFWRLRFAPVDTLHRLPVGGAIPCGPACSEFNRTVTTMDTTRLDLTWYRPPKPEIPQANVLTEARGTVTLPPGRYRLRSISDDAVVVFVDGRAVIEDWNPGESHLKEAEFTATGQHELRLVHLQKDGWYELRLDIERAEAPPSRGFRLMKSDPAASSRLSSAKKESW